MQEAERVEFLSAQSGSVCITYEVAEDGSIATPVRAGKLRRMWEKTRLSAAAVFAVGFPFLFSSCTNKPAKPRLMGTPQPAADRARLLGAIAPRPQVPVEVKAPQPDQAPRVMGKVRVDPETKPAPSKP
jgi:hypothetical protein